MIWAPPLELNKGMSRAEAIKSLDHHLYELQRMYPNSYILKRKQAIKHFEQICKELEIK